MNVPVKSSNGISYMPIETKLLGERKITVGDISEQSASAFVQQMLLLNMENREKPIDLLITSHGGDVDAGLLMYDAIQGSTAPVRMFCLGFAHSMAAVLFISGNHGRYILPHSKLMLHEPYLGKPLGGTVSSVKSNLEGLLERKRELCRILAKHTGKTEEEIVKEIGYDHFYTSEECVEAGLADEIIGFQEMMGGNKNGN